MQFQVREDGTGVVIELTDVGTKQAELLEAFGECQTGRCDCPTDEYDKLASMEVSDAGDSIQVRLATKPGEELNTARIETCLAHTTGKLE